MKRKRVPGGGSSYSKTTRTEAHADTWDSQQTSQMNEVYETERIVSIQRLGSRDRFVSDARNLKLDARLKRQPM